MIGRIWQYALVWLLVGAAQAWPAGPLQLEDMTWPELKARMAQGVDTVIIPSGGTEQNGPHLALGKHNSLVAYTSERIAAKVGNAVVAPVIAYVPEGAIEPPDGHMKFPGTISVRDATFAAVLEDAARSFRQHGFKLICFVGDHGGNIKPQEAVAEKLNAEWAGQNVRVVSLSAYYGNNGQEAWVASLGKEIKEPSAHAGFADTSELLASAPARVRAAEVKPFDGKDFATTGVKGDPEAATAEYGQKLLQMKIDTGVREIEAARQAVAP